MAIAPVHRLKKDEIVWLGTHRCKHSHTYLEHYQCYLKDHPRAQRIGFFDIESSHLKGNWGDCLCWCILDENTGEILSSCLEKRDFKRKDDIDKRVVRECVDALQQFDVIVGYYSTKFDLPYIRTRALGLGLDFPFYGSLKHVDLYYTIKNKFQFHSNRLAVACEFLLGETEKTHINPTIWKRAMRGDQDSLDWILDHCERDVRDLQRLYHKTIDFRYPSMKSI